MYVPNFIRQYTRLQQLASLPIVALLAVASVFVWQGVGVAVLLAALALWFVLKLLGEAEEQSERIIDLEETQSGFVDLEARASELEAEKAYLEQQLAAPSLGVANFLHALDDQANRLEVVEKHRKLKEIGQGEFVVSAISQDGNGGLVIRAHVDESPSIALGEQGVLVHRRSGELWGFGSITSASDTIVQTKIDQEHLNGGALDYALGREAVEPSSLVLRLAGLCFDTYKEMSDDTIREMHQSIRALAKEVAQKLETEMQEKGGGTL
jgi:hypothetical protein